jgi:hypothetical protein
VVTVARAFLRAVSRMPSARADCWSCCSALARVSDSRFWSAGTRRPVVRKGDVDGLAVVVDADVFGFELREIDAGDGLAVDDEEEAVAGEEVWEDGAGLGAFDYGVDGVDDGFEAVEALDTLDDGGYGGVEGGGAAGDGGGDSSEDA